MIRIPGRRAIVALGLFVSLLSVAVAQRLPFPEAAQSTATANELNFIAFGDWGADTPEQKQVAQAMARKSEKQQPPFDAALLLGDNFYMDLPGGTHSPQWRTLFEDMYDSRRMNFPFYVALGNHDYESRKKTQTELDYSKDHPGTRWNLPARWYRLELPKEKPLLTLLVLDSNFKDMPLDQWSEELKWVDAELAKPRAGTWLVCMAHHPIFNNGKHHDDHRLLQDWGPLFQRAKVDFYLTGHDHNLQHLEIPNHSTSFVISGGGGKHAYGIEKKDRGPFGQGTNGFATLRFTPDRATVALFDQDGKRLHQFERTPAGEVKMVPVEESEKPAERVKP